MVVTERALIELDYSIKHPEDSAENKDISVKVNTILAEVNEIIAGSSLEELVESEEEEAVEAVVFF